MDETEIKQKFKADLVRVKDALVAASEHYNIWYIYKNDKDRPKYANVMNRYLSFFRASISAHFTAMLLTLSKVLDKNTRNNRISVYSLIAFAKENNIIESTKMEEIEKNLSVSDKAYEKLQVLRNNVFAHLGKIDSTEAFKKAGISPNDLRDLIDQSIDILRKIYYACDQNDFAFDYYSKEDTYSLLDSLMNMNS